MKELWWGGGVIKLFYLIKMVVDTCIQYMHLSKPIKLYATKRELQKVIPTFGELKNEFFKSLKSH